jgi:uncharacterized membrane protein (UPF0136 family)
MGMLKSLLGGTMTQARLFVAKNLLTFGQTLGRGLAVAPRSTKYGGGNARGRSERVIGSRSDTA